jgi:hypothetical protein
MMEWTYRRQPSYILVGSLVDVLPPPPGKRKASQVIDFVIFSIKNYVLAYLHLSDQIIIFVFSGTWAVS